MVRSSFHFHATLWPVTFLFDALLLSAKGKPAKAARHSGFTLMADDEAHLLLPAAAVIHLPSNSGVSSACCVSFCPPTLAPAGKKQALLSTVRNVWFICQMFVVTRLFATLTKIIKQKEPVFFLFFFFLLFCHWIKNRKLILQVSKMKQFFFCLLFFCLFLMIIAGFRSLTLKTKKNNSDLISLTLFLRILESGVTRHTRAHTHTNHLVMSTKPLAN